MHAYMRHTHACTVTLTGHSTHTHLHTHMQSNTQVFKDCRHCTVVIMRLVISNISWLKWVICMARAPLTMQRFLFSTWIFCCCSLEALKNRHGIRLFVIYLWQIAYFKPRSILQFSISLMTDRERARERERDRENTSVQLSVAICFLIKRK